MFCPLNAGRGLIYPRPVGRGEVDGAGKPVGCQGHCSEEIRSCGFDTSPRRLPSDPESSGRRAVRWVNPPPSAERGTPTGGKNSVRLQNPSEEAVEKREEGP